MDVVGHSGVEPTRLVGHDLDKKDVSLPHPYRLASKPGRAYTEFGFPPRWRGRSFAPRRKQRWSILCLAGAPLWMTGTLEGVKGAAARLHFRLTLIGLTPMGQAGNSGVSRVRSPRSRRRKETPLSGFQVTNIQEPVRGIRLHDALRRAPRGSLRGNPHPSL